MDDIRTQGDAGRSAPPAGGVGGSTPAADRGAPSRRLRGWSLLKSLGPGLITGAADDDPSGIATYSQVGAQFGYMLGWAVLLTYPLMAAIQEISARVGCVTGHGIAGNVRRHYPPAALYSLVALVLVANVINIGADVGAMGASLHMVLGGGPNWLYIVAVGAGTVVLQVFSRYRSYVSWLKWLTLSLLAYVAVLFVVRVDWLQVAWGTFIPHIPDGSDALTSIVAVLGTTISPYLFFWQSQMEVEETEIDPEAAPLREHPRQAPREMRRIRFDTYLGMAISNLAALCIIVTTAATLHSHGVTDIKTAQQAAEALRPIAGDFSAAVFALGLVGTGLMGIPVLSASAAYAIGEAAKWPVGLARQPREAKAFYWLVALATALGVGIVFTPIDPFKALFWSAVVNGVLAPPVMAILMIMASRPAIMGRFHLPLGLKILGWAGTAVMGIAVVVMLLGMAGIV